MYDELKAAQVAAFFLSRQAGRMNVLKLMKLMYLAERESYRELGEPIMSDHLVSMPHGPVLSLTYTRSNGDADPSPEGWDAWIGDRAAHMVQLGKPVHDERRDLDRLSDAELAILARVWERFGQMGQYEIRNWTHENCSEWEDPEGSSKPIPTRRLLRAVGYTEPQANEIAERIDQMRNCNAKVRAIA